MIQETVSNPTSSHTVTSSRTPKYKSMSTTPVQTRKERAHANQSKTMTGSFSTARKTPQRSDVILEKTFTRGKYIKNMKR